MDTRRDFLKKAALLAGNAGFTGVLPASIQKALAIDPTFGSTWRDAEHVVLLMQENRSFDHSFGTLRGVRGFNDPRAINLPNQNRVWLQTKKPGRPMRLSASISRGRKLRGWVACPTPGPTRSMLPTAASMTNGWKQRRPAMRRS